MAITQAAQFKALAVGTEVQLPSGFTVLARRVDVRVMLKTGRIPNSLRPILDRAMQGQETPTEDLTKGVLEDPAKLDEMFGFIDQMWIDCVIEPPTAPNPRPAETDAAGNIIKEAEFDDPNIVYPKDVSDGDKMFMMNWAMGGSSDLERFREEQAVNVQRVHDVAGSTLPPPSSPSPDRPV